MSVRKYVTETDIGNGLVIAAGKLHVLPDPASPTVVTVTAAGVAVAAPTPAQVAAASTNVLASAVNTLTSTVNGIAATAPIINTNTLAWTQAGGLVSTVNGVAATLAIPAGTIAQAIGYSAAGAVVRAAAATPIDAILTAQPTPAATGNVTNLNTIFKDANGDTWLVDSNGDAIKVTGLADPSIAVIDNTITNPANTTPPGRYIVPATGATGVFVGHANQYADFDGTTWTFTTPTTNDKVVILTGLNAGTTYQWNGTVWNAIVVVSTSGMKVLTANVTGVAPNGGAQANNGMTNLIELDIVVPAGKTLYAHYNLSYNQPQTGWGVALDFPNYIAASPITGKSTWQNFNGGGSGETNWWTWAHSPATYAFTRGTFDNTVGKATNNAIVTDIVWKNTSAAAVTWRIAFGTDLNVNNAAAIPRMNIGSSVRYEMV